ncbi:MAG TPA: HD-GYP domain-containing protein [Streptosporangiaceae bacterium]|nr:HD-GYP domain-containing protein [Streptosporangiaceae bacterium]
MSRVSRAAWIYIGAVVIAAASVVAPRLPDRPMIPSWWVILGVLMLLFLICDSTPTPLAARQAAWSPSSAATLAAVVLLGPLGAALVGAVSLISLRRKTLLAERVFNGGMYAVAGFAAGNAFVHLGGHVGLPSPGNFPAIIWPFAAAAAAHVLVNQGLIWGVLQMTRYEGRASRRIQLESSPSLLVASDLGYAALGLVIAALWTVIGPFAAALVLVPLFVARWAMGQFAEQQRAYAATMAALCQAVETKDFYTRGHSERVSRGSGMIARQIGIRGDRAEAIMFAGMLHDVGKLGVPTKVLQKTGPLTEEEFAAIQLHPMRGLEIVREIGFLNEALAGIMHHHEKLDGTGYPMGFAGDEIPEFARVIAVADAFDSMTSTRSYREARRMSEAIDELRKGAGSQFDPVLVEAFIDALHRDGWRLPERAAPPADRQTVTAQDHDDPTAPLRVIESY